MRSAVGLALVGGLLSCLLLAWPAGADEAPRRSWRSLAAHDALGGWLFARQARGERPEPRTLVQRSPEPYDRLQRVRRWLSTYGEVEEER